VLQAYAQIAHGRAHQPYGAELSALVHRDEHVAGAEQQIHRLVRDVLVEAAVVGAVRDDVPADELASFCLHALSAAGRLPSKAAVRRLVTITRSGLRPTT
jgi:hypothetical protein